MLKKGFAYLAILLGVMVLYIAYQGWLAWILLVGLFALPFFSLLISLPAILTLRITLQNRGAVPLGMPQELQIHTQCPLPVPVYQCRVRAVRVMTGESWLLSPGDELPTDCCGQLTLTPVRCWVSDYFGMFCFPVRKLEETRLTVWPKAIKAPVPAQLQRFVLDNWRPKPGGGYAENHEIRLYRPGDSLNQIHWKLSAKTGSLMIREAMEPARGRALLTADLKGTAEELNRIFGRILFMGDYLLDKGMRYELHVLTGVGRLHWEIVSDTALKQAVSELLHTEAVQEGSIQGLPVYATWRCHLGGEPDEA